MQHHSFSRNVPPLSFCWLRLAKRIFSVSRQSNRPVINRIIASLVHELPPWSVDDTKKSENHFVVISLTDKSEATSVEKKVDMKDAPLVGKLGSTEKSKSLKDWVKWNFIYKGYFLKITCARISPSMWGDWADYTGGKYWVAETKSRFIKRRKKELQTLLHVTPGLKPFTVLRSLGRESERLTNDYIIYASTVRRIPRKLLFNHCYKDHSLVPAGLKL